jgi:hypothetical protein
MFGQSVSVNAIGLDASHFLLGEPLVGGGVTLGWSGPRATVAFRVGGEWLRGRADHTGTACAGLIEPGTCLPEQVNDESWLAQGNAGVAVRVLGGGRAALALTADLALASVRADTRGLWSMRSLHARETLWGALVGVETTWLPLPRLPIALDLAANVGGLRPIVSDLLIDGYTPFNDSFRIRLVRVGISWRPLLALGSNQR